MQDAQAGRLGQLWVQQIHHIPVAALFLIIRCCRALAPHSCST